MRADLIKRLRKHAEFETPVIADDQYPPEITWKELGQLAALLSEAADALAAPVSRPEARLVADLEALIAKWLADTAAFRSEALKLEEDGDVRPAAYCRGAAASRKTCADELEGVLVREENSK